MDQTGPPLLFLHLQALGGLLAIIMDVHLKYVKYLSRGNYLAKLPQQPVQNASAQGLYLSLFINIHCIAHVRAHDFTRAAIKPHGLIQPTAPLAELRRTQAVSVKHAADASAAKSCVAVGRYPGP